MKFVKKSEIKFGHDLTGISVCMSIDSKLFIPDGFKGSFDYDGLIDCICDFLKNKFISKD